MGWHGKGAPVAYLMALYGVSRTLYDTLWYIYIYIGKGYNELVVEYQGELYEGTVCRVSPVYCEAFFVVFEAFYVMYAALRHDVLRRHNVPLRVTVENSCNDSLRLFSGTDGAYTLGVGSQQEMTMANRITEQEYYEWAASEPLSDSGVDLENCAHISRDSLNFWGYMMAAGKDAVAMRKEERHNLLLRTRVVSTSEWDLDE